MKILASYHIKGGVGKTTTAINVAWLAARAGFRTLVWDLDPQAAATYCFRIKPKLKGGLSKLVSRKRSALACVRATDYPGLDLLPGDFALRNLDLELNEQKKRKRRLTKLIAPLKSEYDFVFVDCAPSISLASENVFRAADALLIPMIPTPLSLRTYDQLVNYLKECGLNSVIRLPFFSMVDLRKRLHREILIAFKERDPSILRSWIPYSSLVETMAIRRAPIHIFAASTPAARAYAALWSEISGRIANRNT